MMMEWCIAISIHCHMRRMMLAMAEYNIANDGLTSS
jgi:hypothetical protein